MTRPVVFISYSHKDEEEKDRLLTHLGVLEHDNLIDLWSDYGIAAGAHWEQDMREAIANARVAILLISANYLTSDFILSEEVPTLLRRRAQEGVTVFPVIIKPCAWQAVGWLARMNVRPKNGQPIWGERERYVDEELAAIAEEIAAIASFSRPYLGLDRVEFGHIAAEEETHELQRYFVETEEYSSVISEKGKLLVIGRKGSGKSAIYVNLRDHLPKRDPMTIVEALTLENYPWEIHKQVIDTGVPVEQSYVNSWKYIIWLILAKRALGYHEIARYKLVDPLFWRQIFNANRRYLIRFLKQNYGSVAPSFTELLADRARQIRSLKLKDFEVDTEGTADSFQRLSRSINVVNHEIGARVLEILSNNQHYILFDQLDQGWDNTESSKQLLTGLILASRDITRAAKKRDKRVQITIFLRSDIYEGLRFEDKNKLSPDVVELRWDTNRLEELVSKRIETYASGTWDDVFEYQVMEPGVSILQYMTARTMLRPRDMIQFCVFAKEAAIRSSSYRIDGASVREAERPYSEYMRKEIQDESKALSINVDSLFEILGRIGTEKIDREDLIQACRLQKIPEELALRQLIDLSILGIYRSTRQDHPPKVLFRYSASPWEKLEPSSKLQIHPSLKYELGLFEVGAS